MKKIEEFNEFNKMIRTIEIKEVETKNIHMLFHEIEKNTTLSQYEIKERLKDTKNVTNWFG